MKDLKTKFKIKNRTLFENWLKGLRSGKYTQIKNKLHVEGTNKFCALGVLYFQNNLGKVPDYYYSYLIPSSLGTDVLNMNDILNENFLQIADWLERNCEVE